ncbi:MAG: holo-ACP synthase [Clostridiales bacterium]|nr:holo-ACP synthase [Clostridiales bacterium]
MCNVLGIGIDLCEVAQMERLLAAGHSLRLMFTEEEQGYIRERGAVAAQTAAGMFAAKEAVLKALGTGLTLPMTEIVISHTELHQPVVTLTGKAAEKGGRILISITHEGGMAAGMAVWLS